MSRLLDRQVHHRVRDQVQARLYAQRVHQGAQTSSRQSEGNRVPEMRQVLRNCSRDEKQKVTFGRKLGCCGGEVVSVLAFYSDERERGTI